MTVIVNGEPRAVAAGTLAEALQALDYGEAKSRDRAQWRVRAGPGARRDAGEGRRSDRDRRAEAGGVR